jgi:5-methylcytosine-specific restriction protein B
MGSALEILTNLIKNGMPSKDELSRTQEEIKNSIDGIFGERYHSKSQVSRRVVLMAAEENTSFAGLVHHDSPHSGAYGGMSLIWFPMESQDGQPAKSLLTLVCGTRGLSPDEQILGRPGHVRHLKALQRYLTNECGITPWVKHDPTALNEPFPKVVQAEYSDFDSCIKRYGSHIYFCAEVPQDAKAAYILVSSLLDFYAWERNWTPLKAYSAEVDALKLKLRTYLFPRVSIQDVTRLLHQRRFVILQGPPGTGKTRMATEILKDNFDNNGFSVQFHPAVTYETFIAGISPSVDGGALNFQVKPGWLVQAIQKCNGKPLLMHIDEINRADLSRVLGESMYLFESREISQGKARTIQLPYATADGQTDISIPQQLFIVGTMNSADRSIAIMDMAVRRRFAFVDVWPDIDVVNAQNMPLATEAFSRLQDIFTQYATEESFSLMPGHSYFLSDSEAELCMRMEYELIPLLKEYLQEGRLTTCESELRAYIDWLSSQMHQHAG